MTGYPSPIFSRFLPPWGFPPRFYKEEFLRYVIGEESFTGNVTVLDDIASNGLVAAQLSISRTGTLVWTRKKNGSWKRERLSP
jgi:hypothetical protein